MVINYFDIFKDFYIHKFLQIYMVWNNVTLQWVKTNYKVFSFTPDPKSETSLRVWNDIKQYKFLTPVQCALFALCTVSFFSINCSGYFKILLYLILRTTVLLPGQLPLIKGMYTVLMVGFLTNKQWMSTE